LALQFLILTAARTGEVIGAKRGEFDFERQIWTVPASRMKAGREHRVPLSEPVIDLLQTLPTEEDSDFMFIGAKKGTGLSNMAMLELMRDMRPKYVPHGLRSTFKDFCAEQTSFSNMLSEAALAHAIGDKTEAAYRRGDMLEKRRKLMDAWARYCTTKPVEATGKLIPLRKAGSAK
jgi:integrase